MGHPERSRLSGEAKDLALSDAEGISHEPDSSPYQEPPKLSTEYRVLSTAPSTLFIKSIIPIHNYMVDSNDRLSIMFLADWFCGMGQRNFLVCKELQASKGLHPCR